MNNVERATHTPGPWKVGGFTGQRGEAGAKIVSADGRAIASTWGGLREASEASEWRRYHADACLIAAAPELLEALQGLAALDVAHLEEKPDDWILWGLNKSLLRLGDVRKARAAITKATGVQS